MIFTDTDKENLTAAATNTNSDSHIPVRFFFRNKRGTINNPWKIPIIKKIDHRSNVEVADSVKFMVKIQIIQIYTNRDNCIWKNGNIL